jgi:PKHD-type hydroxylase
MHYLLNKVEDYKPVLSVDNFLTEVELEKLNLQFSNINPKAAIAGVPSHLIKNEDDYLKAVNASHVMRKSNVHFCVESEFTWVYDKISIAINHVNLTNYNKVLYGIESLQYTEYDSKYNGFYGPHPDCYEEQNPLLRSLSFTIQLSREEDYEGGDLLIYYGNNTIKANKTYGTITFFDSKILHEVTPVTSGFRKSLVGWILGPRV